ncbi:MAG: ORF6N domain-containing protein [Planctomycetota bacterium]
MSKTNSIVPLARIESAILLIRGQKVMLDGDLGALYGVTTRALNQAVKRNLDRFPDDFMFQLTWDESQNLRHQTGTSSLKSQIVTLNEGANRGPRSQFVTLKRGQNIKYRPYAFTEQGVAMLSSVLKSERAVRVNIEIMRAFVRLRRVLATNAELAKRLDQLEARVGRHDEQFVAVIQAIRKLMEPPPEPKRRRIGFATEADR